MGVVVSISNADPRRDTMGNIMDCHDGDIQFEGGQFLLYCMAYGPCHNNGCASAGCGGRLDHNVSLYTSPNLTSGSWTYVADLLPMAGREQGTYYRVKVVFNPTTRRHVLWINVLPRPGSPAPPPDFSTSSYLVAVSAAGPAGPYAIVETNATTKYGEGGDFSVFVDDDAAHTAYLIYTSLAEAHSISIAPLNADFTASLPSRNTDFLPGTGHTGCYEAPAMFKRDGVYYALAGPCSCFGKGGSDTWIFTARAPLGPYTRVGQLGNAEHAQQNYVFEAPVIGGTAFVWTGDRWKSTPDGQKAHDFQYWQPLEFGGGAKNASAVGYFARCDECHPPDPVYWVDAGAVLHHIAQCQMCGRDLCAGYTVVTPAWVRSRTVGAEFACGMLPPPAIAPLQSATSLPTLDLRLDGTAD